MQIWLIVGIGGFIGAVSRYLASGWFQNSFTTFPVGTLGVNLLAVYVGKVCAGFLESMA
jgi:fluoride exporter